MQTREFFYKLANNRTALFIGQIFALIVSLAYIDYVYTYTIYPDKHVKENFIETECNLVNKSLGTHGHIIHSYRADFLISYSVGDLQYSHWVAGNGLDMSFSSNKQEQEDLLSQYDVGQSYPCWVSPDDPNVSVLVLRHHWLTTAPMIIPSIIFVIVFYYFIKNVSAMLAITRSKTR